MGNAFKDILGFAGKAADGLFLGGAIHASQRRNKFSDFIQQGQFDQAQQLALRNNEGGFAQFAQEQGAAQSKAQKEQLQAANVFAVGALQSIRKEKDPQRRLDLFNALGPIAKMQGFDDEDLIEFASVLDNDAEIDATISALGGAAGSDETFGVAPQFIRGPDGKVQAVQFGNRGTIRAQDAGGVPLPLELRQIQVDQGQQRIDQAFQLADPAFKGAQAQEAGFGREIGKQTAQAQLNLPGAEAKANQSVGLIDTLLSHPALNARYGLRGVIPAVPGTPGAEFDALRDQLKGQAFLQAFEALKGGGQITEVEGKKATDAISSVFNAQQSPEAARKALQELREIVNRGAERARLRAGQGGATPQQAQSAPQPGTIEEGYRFLGGDPADPNNWEPAQ